MSLGRIILTLLLIGGASEGQAASNSPALTTVPPRTLIHHVHIISMNDAGGIIEDGFILVESGRIVRVGPEAGAPRDVGLRSIDGRAGWVIPGLIDSHMHYDKASELASFIRYGVTTTLSLGDDDEVMKSFPAVTARIAAGTLRGPKVYAAGAIIANQIRFETTGAARDFVRAEAGRGHPFIKVYNDTSREIFDAVVDEARLQHLGVFGHMPRAIPPQYVVSNGLNVLAHMEELFFTALGGPRDSGLEGLTPDWKPDLREVDGIFDLMAQHQVAIIPNLVASYQFFALWVDPKAVFTSPEMTRLEPDVAADWKQYHYARRSQIEKRMLRERLKMPLLFNLTWRAREKGVLLLAGTDSPIPGLFPGASLHEELRLLVASGLTNAEALATATRNAGAVVHDHVDSTTCIGVIQERCEADLVLLSANPLTDIRNTESIVGVMSDGRWFASEDLSRP